MSDHSSGAGEVFLDSEDGELTRNSSSASAADPEEQEMENIHVSYSFCTVEQEDLQPNATQRRTSPSSAAKNAQCPNRSVRLSQTFPLKDKEQWAWGRKLEGLHPSAARLINTNKDSAGAANSMRSARQSRGKSFSGAVPAGDTQDGIASLDPINEKEISSIARFQSERAKKLKTPFRTLTFSVGSHSDRRGGALGFLGKGEKRIMDENMMRCDSPILVNRGAHSSPVSSPSPARLATPDGGWKEEQVHPKLNLSEKQDPCFNSYLDITTELASSPTQMNRYQSPNLFPLCTSVRSNSTDEAMRKEDSPILAEQYSPSLGQSGLSSYHNSSESVSLDGDRNEAPLPVMDTSSPSSRGHSPPLPQSTLQQSATNKLDVNHQKIRRKLSDPYPPDGESFRKFSSSSMTGGIKKGHTFCVRPTKVASQPGRVNGTIVERSFTKVRPFQFSPQYTHARQSNV